jgi:HEPN domain-containing protein
MSAPIPRRQLQLLAEAKLRDSQILFKAGSHSNAYYLAGYSVELALKSCIARTFKRDVIPDKSFVSAVYTHSLSSLVGLAGLKVEIERESKNNPLFKENWNIVKQWTEESRYTTTEKAVAQYFIIAAADETNGILPWIKKHW